MFEVSNLPIDYRDIYNNFVMPVSTSISLQSVILSSENSEKVQEFLTEQANKAKFLEHNLLPMNKLLFSGDSGTGKTFLSKALSHTLNREMLYVDISRTTSTGAAENIAKIFSLASYMKDVVLFFDECDSVAFNRRSEESANPTERKATTAIFQGIDNMDKNVIFIAASNLFARLDPAFIARFQISLDFLTPAGIDMVSSIEKFIHQDFVLDMDLDTNFKNSVETRCKLSYREIQSTVEHAMKKAIILDTDRLSAKSIYKDLAFAAKIRIGTANINSSKDKSPDYLRVNSGEL